MKITQRQLKSIIREEFLQATASKGKKMTETRARLVTEQLLGEGLWDTIKAGFSGLSAAGSDAAQKLGDEAAKGLAIPAKAVQQVAAAAKSASQDVANAIGKIKDETLKKAAEGAQASFKDSIKASLQKEISDGLSELTGAGMEENEAVAITILTCFDEDLSIVSCLQGIPVKKAYVSVGIFLYVPFFSKGSSNRKNVLHMF